MNPKISIIIPVYNASQYIAQCIESVIAQTYSDIQIICVDDGSMDTSLQILNEYADKDHRIVVIHKKNEGVSLARNAALEVATGDYIMFVDGDDWIELDTCAVAVETIQEFDADVVMWSYIRETSGESRKKSVFESDMVFESEAVRERLYRRMVGVYGEETAKPENADSLCTVWGKLYKRALIEEKQIRFYDIREIGTYEDGLFNLKVFSKVGKAVFIDRYFYHYRRGNDSSVTTAYNEKMPQQWNRLFEVLNDYITDNDLDETFGVALNNRIAFSLIALGINETEKRDGMFKTVKRISKIINGAKYRNAIKELDFNYLPLHWKLFFMCAKHRIAIGVYLLLLVIQKIRGR